jgi:hypothetical protein
MPSGFQQDQNQLTPSFYRVTIDCGNENATWYDTSNEGATPEEMGRISALSWDNFAGGDRPTTQLEADALARGNLRFQYIVEALSNLADCQILDIEVGAEANGDAQATSIAFTVKFDRDAGVVDATTKLNGSATAVDGATAVTTVAIAIRDQFVRGFRDATTYLSRVYDGALGTDNQISLTVAAPDVVADIWADTTVTAIDGTELVTLDNAGDAE